MKRLLAAAVGSVCFVASANAAILTYEFTSTVSTIFLSDFNTNTSTYVDSYAAPRFTVQKGDIIHGSFTINTAPTLTGCFESGDSICVYFDPNLQSHVRASINGTELQLPSSDANDNVVTQRSLDGLGYNRLNIQSNTSPYPISETSNIQFMAEPQHVAVVDGAIPLAMLNLTPNISADYGYSFSDYATGLGYSFYGAMTSLTYIGSAPGNNPPLAVPEPETYGMMIAGMALVAFAARRRANKPTSPTPASVIA
jgi:opacity protein-like surface antigen